MNIKKILIMLSIGVSIFSISIPVYANICNKSDEFNSEIITNDSLKVKEQMERNWLTEEVSRQLNKELSELKQEDFLKIKKIDLKYEKIDDTIPKEIGLMKNLEYLDLNYCRLYGDIPNEICKLDKLKYIDLEENKLESIPVEMIKMISDAKYDFCSIEANEFELDEGWYYLKQKWYYFNEYGEKLRGSQIINGIQYDFTEDGYINLGWKEEDGKKYYYDKVNGIVKKDWKFIDGKWYYFDNDGVMMRGLKDIGGKYFYFSDDGDMKNGLQEINRKKYFFNNFSGMQYGWIDLDGKRYYADINSGEIVSNEEKTIDGFKYRFLSDGSLMKNGWIDDYHYINPNGEIVEITDDYSHSQTNYNAFKYMTDSNNRVSVHFKAIELHDGITANNCVFFTSEVLRRVGVNLSEDTCNTYDLEEKLKSKGYIACYDLSQLKPGDIVFSNGYTHVYIFMGWDKNGYAYIVDNQADRFDNKILHLRQIYNDTELTDRATHFYYSPY